MLRFVHQIRRECLRLKIALHSLIFRPVDYQPVFILCTPRTGSNLLLSYLNSINGVFLASEILSGDNMYGLRRFAISTKAVIRHIRHSMNYRRRPISGAKFFFSHLKALGITLDNLMEAFPTSKWIILYRKNLAAQFISNECSTRTGEYRRYPGHLKKSSHMEPFDFDCQKAESFCKSIHDHYRQLLDHPSHNLENSLWINYEELESNPQAVFDQRVFPFLGIERQVISTSLLRQRPDSYAEIIKNVAELVKFQTQAICKHSYE